MFAAVYAPNWPREEEYVLTCSTLYYAPLPLGLATLLFATFVVGVCCFKRSQNRSTESPIIITRENRPTQRQYKRTWHQRATRYGALDNK